MQVDEQEEIVEESEFRRGRGAWYVQATDSTQREERGVDVA